MQKLGKRDSRPPFLRQAETSLEKRLIGGAEGSVGRSSGGVEEMLRLPFDLAEVKRKAKVTKTQCSLLVMKLVLMYRRYIGPRPLHHALPKTACKEVSKFTV